VSASKLKNLVIAALLLINVFFAAILLYDRGGEALERQRALDNIRTVLANGGVAISISAPREGGDLRALSTSRDTAAEESVALALIGSAERVDLGGNIFAFENEKGRATFNMGGEFAVELVYSAETGDALTVARRVLRATGIETTEPEVHGSDGDETVATICAYKKTPVFNCPVSLEFEGGQLTRVSGRMPTGVRAGGGAGIAGLESVLLRFGEAVRSGIACSEVYDAIPGYRFYVGAFGEGELAPGWRLVTDVGVFFVNSLTNEVETLDE
jgi:hypothetical protein